MYVWLECGFYIRAACIGAYSSKSFSPTVMSDALLGKFSKSEKKFAKSTSILPNMYPKSCQIIFGFGSLLSDFSLIFDHRPESALTNILLFLLVKWADFYKLAWISQTSGISPQSSLIPQPNLVYGLTYGIGGWVGEIPEMGFFGNFSFQIFSLWLCMYSTLVLSTISAKPVILGDFERNQTKLCEIMIFT